MHATLFLGAGPAGLGPLVFAAQTGQLAAWLDRGIGVIERRAAPAPALSGYALFADSFGTSFLECADAPGADPLLARLRASAEHTALRPFRDARPPLGIVGAYLARLEAEMEHAVRSHPRGVFARGREVQAIFVERDHVVVEHASVDGSSVERCAAETAVVAFGGEQTLSAAAAAPLGSLGPLGALAGDRLSLADRLLTEGGATEAMERLARAARPEIVIVGGSHNAFSVAWLLTARAPKGLFAKGSITIVSRRPPRVFYRSAEEAAADGYRAFTDEDICPRTRRVHQLGGLRGDGRELWRRVTARPGTEPETRVSLLDFETGSNPEELAARVRRATLVVAATGYRPRTPTVLRDGARVPLLGDNGGPTVDERCRLLTAAGEPLDRIFSLGLASGFIPSGEMGGEPSFRGHTNGVWLYQNRIGARIHGEIQAQLARRAEDG